VKEKRASALATMTNPAPLSIPRYLLETIYRQARDEYPNECCGWLAGEKDANAVSIVKACVNMQAQGQHPTAPNRPAETAYVFGAEDLMELNRSLDGDTPPRIIYHSHPNGHAYLSETDRNVATSPWGDGPAYPVQQLVVGLDGQRVVEAALFAWFDDGDGFVEVARFEGASI
jgi:proteasome lid subunit RPN8/RPN11